MSLKIKQAKTLWSEIDHLHRKLFRDHSETPPQTLEQFQKELESAVKPDEILRRINFQATIRPLMKRG